MIKRYSMKYDTNLLKNSLCILIESDFDFVAAVLVLLILYAINQLIVFGGDGMFKKKDELKNDQATFSIESVEVKKSSTDTNPAAKDGNTILGQDISIEGSIRGEENI
ncbi:MAG: hypothetical protein E3J94_04395 [Desulfobacteraceae bacterium]|nr:MAG: hypothetical protein E3J94_04395 [Desulfobacteraceae bacterium]